MNVFICEDNSVQRERLEKYIDNIILIENLDMEISLSTSSPKEIIEFVKVKREIGIYFLDIELKDDINGIQLAEQIREYDPRGFIIFITTHAEMSYLTFLYKVEALDYIIKDYCTDIRDRIKDCILKANRRNLGQNKDVSKAISIKHGDKIIRVDYDKILYFATSDIVHKIKLHTTDRVVEFYGKMKEIESQLDERFYRCHRSFLINKDNIQEVDKVNKRVYMKNGEECYVSSRLMKGLIK